MATLKLDWCSHAAAKYAVEHWHYSKTLPMPPLVRVGVWEDDRFIGCVLFSRGAAMNLGKPYGLKQTEICELSRIALADHHTPVSRIVSIAIKMLQQTAALRLIVSFADLDQGHVGGVYQAGGWVYTGETGKHWMFMSPTGKKLHPRQVSVSGLRPEFGKTNRVDKIADCTRIAARGKHRYLMPLDAEMRARILPLSKPYPKRAVSTVASAPPVQGGEDGSKPITALSQ